MKVIQVQIYIQQKFHDEQWTKFMKNLTPLERS